MPIEYAVSNEGRLVHATASHPVKYEDLAEYETTASNDARVKHPMSELFVVEADALKGITKDDIEKVVEQRKAQPSPTKPHQCAIVISLEDAASWKVAKFYEAMAKLHYPKNVIVFGDIKIARIWLGVEE